MSVYEQDQVREGRRIPWAGWAAVWVMYAVVLAVIGVIVVAAGGGAP